MTASAADSTTRNYARALDAADPLRGFRDRFHLPRHSDGEPVVYLTGNSLGLQPKSAAAAVQAELAHWAEHGVEGHFRPPSQWLDYHRFLTEPLARLVGAEPEEVVAMNTLTVNLHLLLISFYRPTATRYKLLLEGGAFPSDQYAAESQVRLHGFDPADAIVELRPRAGEATLRSEDIEAAIRAHGESLATILLGGVNYYTGQLFDMASITRWGHEVGALVGFDLAHAAGNVPLRLHAWDVDFACWCSYKYLNSGPGGVSGAFVHQRFAHRPDLPRLAGWWGHDPAVRFQMKSGFRPAPGAEGWQLSNAQILPMAVHRAALALVEEAGGMIALREKSLQLTGYLANLLRGLNLPRETLDLITPQDPAQRGCQLSLLVGANGRALFDALTAEGIVADWREPNVIRIAPVPLYNSFEDAWRFADVLRRVVGA
ncbi:MAG: kynureninase [Hymenobacteraceae bacterium]|nr:kynureninase [Hymenobacteraceae bacterium]